MQAMEEGGDRDTDILVLSHLNVHLRQLCPGDKLARCAVDSLLCELQGPVESALAAEEVALDVEEGVRLRGLLEGEVDDLESLDLLVCQGSSRMPVSSVCL